MSRTISLYTRRENQLNVGERFPCGVGTIDTSGSDISCSDIDRPDVCCSDIYCQESLSLELFAR